jgi:hypothetical protein
MRAGVVNSSPVNIAYSIVGAVAYVLAVVFCAQGRYLKGVALAIVGFAIFAGLWMNWFLMLGFAVAGFLYSLNARKRQRQ